MIKFNDLQEGDIVMAEYEGQQSEGVVTELNREDKEVCVRTDIQAFWFTPEHLYPVPLSEAHLSRLGFSKQVNGDGSAKYLKEAFRLVNTYGPRQSARARRWAPARSRSA